MSPIKEPLANLIACPSLTPKDEGCQAIMMQYLKDLGFQCQIFNNLPVSNFFARYGDQKPLLVFAGHTDVVPVGDIKQWQSDPFTLTEKDGHYYGRGVADMKGSLACMLLAVKNLLKHSAKLKGSIGFLITSGEEGDDFELGTPYVMAKLKQQGIIPDYCIVGEPSSQQQLGDMVKIGRRGSLTGRVVIQGKQGHVAYPHLAINPIHQASPALLELTTTTWDQGGENFPPTSFQITHIEASGKAGNVIPGELTLHFNFRYSTMQTAAKLKAAIDACFKRHQLKTSIQWQENGLPFLTAPGALLDACLASIKAITGLTPELSTSGGTSDARFIAPYGIEVIELGPVNATIHQLNEKVRIADLNLLADVYREICVRLCC